MEELHIVSLKKEHLKQVVYIHMKAFPGFFLTFLGEKFIYTFYSSFIGEKLGITWVAEDRQSGRVLGVVIGTSSPNGFYKKLARRRWGAFGLSAIKAALKKPAVIRRLFRALYYRGDPPSQRGYALLSSIAVSPDAQEKGVGKALLNRWMAEAEKRLCTGAYLTTDALGNDAVNRFYQQCGWKVESSFVTPEGRKMNRYVLSFPRDIR